MQRHTPRIAVPAVVAALLLLLAMSSCGHEPFAQTVDGPEATNLIENASGYVVSLDGGAITAISLPKLEQHVVRRLPRSPEGYGAIVHALSGPDQEGRIAYIEDYFFVKNEKEKRHLLRTVQVDGTADTEIFARPGSAMWATTAAGNGEIGSHISLAPKGGRVAFISKVVDKQMPQALLNVGRLEIWNVAEKSGKDTGVIALDEPMSWFPDGKRLAYAVIVPRAQIAKDSPGIEEFGNYLGNQWEELPAIYILDTETGMSTFFHLGWQSLVENDGGHILVGGWGPKDFIWRRVSVDGRGSTPFTLPGATDVFGKTAEGITSTEDCPLPEPNFERRKTTARCADLSRC